MERWQNKIAVVTGASSGIGSSISRILVKNGLIVIGVARNIDNLIYLQNQINDENLLGKFYYKQCDITNIESIKNLFKWINDNFKQNLHILINNAGIFKYTGILLNDNDNTNLNNDDDDDICNAIDNENDNDLQNIINTNFMGTIYCTKYAYKTIIKQHNQNNKNNDDSNDNNFDKEYHIININSILGNYVPVTKFSKTYNVYPSSKFAVRAASEVIRQELLDNNNFRISNISPGLVKTEITHKGEHPSANDIINMKSILNPDDIANAIVYVLSVPKHVQISQLTIIPVGQKF